MNEIQMGAIVDLCERVCAAHNNGRRRATIDALLAYCHEASLCDHRTPPPPRPTDQQPLTKRIVSVLQQEPARVFRAADIIAATGFSGPRQTLLSTLADLAKAGRVRRVQFGHYSAVSGQMMGAGSGAVVTDDGVLAAAPAWMRRGRVPASRFS